MNSISETIAIYLPSLRGGGAERVMVTLANAFAERGFTVDLVLASATGPYLSEVSSAVNLVNLKRSRVVTSLPGLVWYLRWRKPTALLSAMGHANLVALLAKKIAGVATRVVVSEREDPSVRNGDMRSIRSGIIDFANRYFYATADAIHAVSYGVGRAVAKKLRLPVESVQVVYNPIDIKHISQLSDDEVTTRLIVNDDCRLVVSVGRLSKEKDYSTLVKAVSLVRKVIDVRLVILGEGDMRSELEQLISELGLEKHVALPGFCENPFSVMKRADLFILSSIWEGLPNGLIQAMACGTQVVATDCPSGPSEILENGKWGRLVKVGDVDAMSLAIIEALNEETHPDVAIRAGDFNVDNAVSGYLALLFPDFLK